MNQTPDETRRSSSRLSEALSPYQRDLNLDWGAASLPVYHEAAKAAGPEYLNTPQNVLPQATGDNLDNPEYQATFLPQASSTSFSPNPTFSPAAENMEYMGLGAALHHPVR